ncbi:unnamed protein product [Blepharisma stoltei]|uniref:Uncharacterized protein n=1 Tax=Blepharisma stoltei TaxID=1481888 RepID=A0AAU9KNN6_9CILI|nr:unnamed protein product [Blepharisma stoltei]
MTENCKDKFNIFSGMFSLIFNSLEEGSSKRLPDIFSYEEKKIEEAEIKENAKEILESGPIKASKKMITACPHVDRRHYAKSMCNNCYHTNGRPYKAWNCPHKDRQLYAKGMCQFCYLQSYHRSRSCKGIKIECSKV